MKKQISIFVAGSKSFKQQRMSLKALANDLNAQYIDQKRDVVLHMCSYENFGDSQQEYNQFIEEVAGLVIFVLEGSVGDRTREEFNRAAAKYKQEGGPKILVFLKEFDEETEGIREIEQMLKEGLGADYYYIPYTSIEDLCAKARERINSHVHQVMRKRMLIRQLIGGTLLLLLAMVCFGISQWWLFVRDTKTEIEPMLVFLGGGSAANFLEGEYDYDVRNNKYTNSLYINMPSSQAYTMMADEVFENHTRQTNPSFNNSFYPVCLSAAEAKESDFADSNVSDERKEFAQKGIIIACHLGEDPISAHFYYRRVEDVPFDSIDTPISSDELEQYLRTNDSIKLYTTRPKSGTFKTYLECTHNAPDAIPAKRRGIYYMTTEVNSLVDDIDKTDYLGFALLGSKYYTVHNFDTLRAYNTRTCFVRPVVKDGKVLTKPIYLYMVGYRQEDGSYTIPKVGCDFLNQVFGTDTFTCRMHLLNSSGTPLVRSIKDFDFDDK